MKKGEQTMKEKIYDARTGMECGREIHYACSL